MEWFWGLSKGSLPLGSDFNSFQSEFAVSQWCSVLTLTLFASVRADMVQSYNEDGWRLVPTPDTLKAIETMLRHNARADDNSRKVFTEVRSHDLLDVRWQLTRP